MNEKTMNMNLEEFKEHVAEKLKTKMPQLEIKTVQQEKNNGVSKWGIRMNFVSFLARRHVAAPDSGTVAPH